MKILSIVCYILCGAAFFSAGDLMIKAVITGNEDPAFILGTLVPPLFCFGLGIFFGKLGKRKRVE